MTRGSVFLAAGLLVLCCGACFAQSSGFTVDFRYTDASVAPQYHRSYTILVNQNKCRVTVSDYSTKLRDTTVTIPARQLKLLKRRCATIVGDVVRVGPSDEGITGSWVKKLMVNCREGSCTDSWNSSAKLDDRYISLLETLHACVPFLQHFIQSTRNTR